MINPILPGVPALDVHDQTARRQSARSGYHNDFLGVLPLGRDGRRALLVSNHEYTNEELMFPGFTSQEALTVEHGEAAVGLAVVVTWRLDGGPIGG